MTATGWKIVNRDTTTEFQETSKTFLSQIHTNTITSGVLPTSQRHYNNLELVMSCLEVKKRKP